MADRVEEDRLMGHAPPRDPGELRRKRERQKARQAWLAEHVPPGRILGATVWALAIVFAALNGSWAVLVLLLWVLASVYLGPRAPGLARGRRRELSPEEWFRRELAAAESPWAQLPSLELELDYRLGLKQRPERPLGRFALEGERPDRPTQPPPKPSDSATSARPRKRELKPVGVEPEVFAAAKVWLVARYGAGKVPEYLAVSMARKMQRVRSGGHRGAYIVVNDALGDDTIYSKPPTAEARCTCGHYAEVHTPVKRLREDGQTRTVLLCTSRECSGCSEFTPVDVVHLDGHGMPSPANPDAPMVELPEMWVEGEPVRELGDYPRLPPQRSSWG
jgi:hypothetical protein